MCDLELGTATCLVWEHLETLTDLWHILMYIIIPLINYHHKIQIILAILPLACNVFGLAGETLGGGGGGK